MSLEIGIICATEEERTALHDAFGLHDAEPCGPFGVFAAQSGRYRVHVAQGGIGKAAAAALTAHLLTAYPGIELLTFCGVAGGMSEQLSPGDLVVALQTATHDYGALRSGRLDWFPVGDIPIGRSPVPEYRAATARTPALERTMARFRSAPSAPQVVGGRVISGDVFLNCRIRRDALQSAWDAHAIDMESAAVVDTARRFGKPVLILRTLSDRACEESHLTYQQVADRAARNSVAFLQAFLEELDGDAASLGLLRG